MLVKAANIFVEQASALARKFKISDYTIGFTIVALGTSLPEMVSTIFSATSGHNQLVVSNIIGSNIVNLCLILGLIAAFNTYTFKKREVDVNIPLNAVAMMVFWGFAVWSGFMISWPFGISLILVFAALTLLSKDYNHFSTNQNKKYVEYRGWIIVTSLILLLGSGKICIDSLVNLSGQLNISETILGYFLLAAGTSLPELATTWAAVRKKEGEMGLGNILGSNLFNLLFILGVSSFIRPVELTEFKMDLMFLTGAILAVYLLAVFGKKYSFSRKEGWILLLIFAGFVWYQIGGKGVH